MGRPRVNRQGKLRPFVCCCVVFTGKTSILCSAASRTFIFAVVCRIFKVCVCVHTYYSSEFRTSFRVYRGLWKQIAALLATVINKAVARRRPLRGGENGSKTRNENPPRVGRFILRMSFYTRTRVKRVHYYYYRH